LEWEVATSLSVRLASWIQRKKDNKSWQVPRLDSWKVATHNRRNKKAAMDGATRPHRKWVGW
jgi:hypothetical protein